MPESKNKFFNLKRRQPMKKNLLRKISAKQGDRVEPLKDEKQPCENNTRDEYITFLENMTIMLSRTFMEFIEKADEKTLKSVSLPKFDAMRHAIRLIAKECKVDHCQLSNEEIASHVQSIVWNHSADPESPFRKESVCQKEFEDFDGPLTREEIVSIVKTTLRSELDTTLRSMPGRDGTKNGEER